MRATHVRRLRPRQQQQRTRGGGRIGCRLADRGSALGAAAPASRSSSARSGMMTLAGMELAHRAGAEALLQPIDQPGEAVAGDASSSPIDECGLTRRPGARAATTWTAAASKPKSASRPAPRAFEAQRDQARDVLRDRGWARPARDPATALRHRRGTAGGARCAHPRHRARDAGTRSCEQPLGRHQHVLGAHDRLEEHGLRAIDRRRDDRQRAARARAPAPDRGGAGSRRRSARRTGRAAAPSPRRCAASQAGAGAIAHRRTGAARQAASWRRASASLPHGTMAPLGRDRSAQAPTPRRPCRQSRDAAGRPKRAQALRQDRPAARSSPPKRCAHPVMSRNRPSAPLASSQAAGDRRIAQGPQRELAQGGRIRRRIGIARLQAGGPSSGRWTGGRRCAGRPPAQHG